MSMSHDEARIFLFGKQPPPVSGASTTASQVWGGGSGDRKPPPTTFGDASSDSSFSWDGNLNWVWCSVCNQYTTFGHQCSGTTWPNPTYTYVNPIWSEIKDLLERLVSYYESPPETELLTATIDEFRPERPFILHFKGRTIPQADVDGIRTQLDDYVSGKDTRPLVISYDGEVSWVTDPDVT